MTNEFVRIMIELWTSDAASYVGRYYSCENVNIKPKCVQRPHVPIWVGGSSRNAMRRVAEFGDVWHPLAFQPVDDAHYSAHEQEFTDSMQTGGTTPELLRRGLDYIQDLAATSGRDLSDLKVVMMAGRSLNPRGDENRVVDKLGRYIEAGSTGFSMSGPRRYRHRVHRQPRSICRNHHSPTVNFFGAPAKRDKGITTRNRRPNGRRFRVPGVADE